VVSGVSELGSGHAGLRACDPLEEGRCPHDFDAAEAFLSIRLNPDQAKLS